MEWPKDSRLDAEGWHWFGMCLYWAILGYVGVILGSYLGDIKVTLGLYWVFC